MSTPGFAYLLTPGRTEGSGTALFKTGKEFVFLKHCFSKSGHKTSISITWELNRNAECQVPPQIYEIRNSGVGPAICVSNKPPVDPEAELLSPGEARWKRGGNL